MRFREMNQKEKEKEGEEKRERHEEKHCPEEEEKQVISGLCSRGGKGNP